MSCTCTCCTHNIPLNTGANELKPRHVLTPRRRTAGMTQQKQDVLLHAAEDKTAKLSCSSCCPSPAVKHRLATSNNLCLCNATTLAAMTNDSTSLPHHLARCTPVQQPAAPNPAASSTLFLWSTGTAEAGQTCRLATPAGKQPAATKPGRWQHLHCCCHWHLLALL